MSDLKVLLFLARGFEDLEAVSVISACGWTEYRDEIPTVRVVTTGFHEVVEGRFGMSIRCDLPMDAVDPNDYAALALPGGFHSHGFGEAYDPRVHELARAVHSNAGTIATMCVGVLPVAEAGLLRGGRATTYPHSRYHDNPARLRDLGCDPTPGPVEVWNRIISCSGPAHSLEVSWLLIESLIGSRSAAEVKRYMVDRSVGRTTSGGGLSG